MNPVRNLPVLLREQDGSIIAECPLLPGYSCKSASRIDALNKMQQLLKHALAAGTPAELQQISRYEIVHVAITAPREPGRPRATGTSKRAA